MPELNKYLKHHRLDKHLRSTKNDKVQVITKDWLFQMNPEGADLLQTGLRERDEAENEPLLDSDNDDSDEAVERPAITHSGRANNTIAINMRSVLATSVHTETSLPGRLY